MLIYSVNLKNFEVHNHGRNCYVVMLAFYM